jgi:CRISPR system Cascade subunit CasA
MKNRFNLVDEPWIPVVGSDIGRVSLKELFLNTSIKSLTGNAIHKVALLKIFLAIAQRAYTPINDEDWFAVGSEGLAKRCVEYLENNKELFWLYGSKPFLQKTDLLGLKDLNGKDIPLGILGKDYPPDMMLENESVVFESQQVEVLSDAEKAVFIITLMNYSLGGKRIIKNIPPWTKGYAGKTISAKGGPSIGNYEGYQNSHLLGESIIDTIWLNLFTRSQLNKFPQWQNDKLVPPWECFPTGEDDQAARQLKDSFMSTLCAVSRFVLLHEKGIFYAEGLQYPSHKDGWREPFMTYQTSGDQRILWNNPNVKPWRNLPALLNTVFHTSEKSSFYSPQIGLLLLRARNARASIGIWSGGLKVRTTSGDMSVKQSDDFIDSSIFLETSYLGSTWYSSLENEILLLNEMEKSLERAIKGYYKEFSIIKPQVLSKALQMFWDLCGQYAQTLVNICEDKEKMDSLRSLFIKFMNESYNKFCPNESAKQMVAWAKNIPFIPKGASIKKEITND